jgi:hypothetical protein
VSGALIDGAMRFIDGAVYGLNAGRFAYMSELTPMADHSAERRAQLTSRHLSTRHQVQAADENRARSPAQTSPCCGESR